jgi:hypothetical protein
MSNINEKISKTTDLIDGVLGKYPTTDLEQKFGKMFSKDIEKSIDNLERVKFEINNNLYFLVIVGGVKSGKSSLINVLSGKKIATTAQGVETTSLPSIVSFDKEKNKIIVYKKNSFSGVDDENLLNAIIDDIKGFKHSLKKYPGWGKIEEEEYDESNLSKYVANFNNPDPDILMVNIRIKPEIDSLIQSNIAIIDTPGIDGVKATLGGTRDGDNEGTSGLMLIKRSDYILFVQSSITPITYQGIKFLDKLEATNQKRKALLVHNTFAINHWRTEISNEIEEKQIKEGLKAFKKYDISVNSKSVDLGKAQDGLFKEYDLKDSLEFSDLLEESKIQSLKDDILNNIENNGKNDHYTTQINTNLRNDYNEIKQIIDHLSEEFKIKVVKTKKELNDSFNTIINSINEIISDKEALEKKLKSNYPESGYNPPAYSSDENDMNDDMNEQIDKLFKHHGESLDLEIEKFSGHRGINEQLKVIVDKKQKEVIKETLEEISFVEFINEKLRGNIKENKQVINEIMDEVGHKSDWCSQYTFDSKILNKNIYEIEDFSVVYKERLGGWWFDDKEKFDISKTKKSLKKKCNEIMYKFTTFIKDDTIESLKESLTQYRDEILTLKNETLEDFENKYYQNELTYINNAKVFKDTIGEINREIINV